MLYRRLIKDSSTHGGPISAKKLFANLLKYGFVAAIFYFLVRYLIGSWEEIAVEQIQVNVRVMASALLLFYFFYVVTGWLMTRIINDCGGNLDSVTGIRIWALAMFGKYLPGKIWIVFGRIYLLAEQGIGKRITALSLMYEVLFQFFAAALFIATLLPQMNIDLPFPDNFLIALWAGLVISFVLILLSPRFINFFVAMFFRGREWQPLSIPPVCYKVTFVLKYLLLYYISWLFIGGGLFQLIKSLKPIGHEQLLGVMGLTVLAWLVGFVSVVTPGGLGVREGALSYLLSSRLSAHLSVLVSLLSRVVLVVTEILFVLSFEFFYRFMKRRAKGESG